MNPTCSAVIVAGGVGSRMKAERPKQFLSLAGRPLLAHTLRSFQVCPEIGLVILVLPNEGFEEHRVVMEPFCEGKPHRLVAGGASRQDSVQKGLAAIEADEGDDVLVAVHDGARPFVEPSLVAAVIEAARREPGGGAIAAIPVVETLKVVDEAMAITSTVDRKRYYRAQTPQVFPLTLLRQSFDKAKADGFRGTDEASLVERLGAPIRVVSGSERNLKVTTAADLELAEYYLQSDADRAD